MVKQFTDNGLHDCTGFLMRIIIAES